MLKLLSSNDGGMNLISQASTNMSKYAKSMKEGGIIPALEAVTDMVNKANEMNKVLETGLGKIDIKANLGKVASAVGLGGKAQYTIKQKDVNIHIDMTVTMNAGEIEKVIFMNKGSFVRQRLDWLTDNAGASPQILQGNPYTQTGGAPGPIGNGGASGGGK